MSIKEDSLVNDLRLKVLDQLNKQNDGNKLYSVRAFTQNGYPEDQALPLNRLVSSFFEDSSDVYCLVEVAVDPKKHVKPLEVKKPSAPNAPTVLTGDDKFVSLVKYSYYESG